jgi:hypothetical protein
MLHHDLMHPFRKAVEDRDEAAIQAMLADNVVFTSPVAFKPYVGKPITAAILRGVLDFLHFDDDGRIDDFMVMVRPLSGATALSEAMGAQFGRIQEEALELAERFA